MAAFEIKFFDPTLQAEEGFTNSCRVCMRSKVVLKNVFSTELARTAEELMFCTGVLMTEGDGLPAMLCDSCLTNLSVAYEFKSTCVRSDKLLRQFLREQVLVERTIKKEVVEELDYQRAMKLEVNCHVDDCMTKQEVMKGEDDDDNDYGGDICHIKDEQIHTKRTNKKKPRARQKTIGKTKIDSVIKTTQTFQSLYCDVCNLSFTSKELCLEHNRKLHTPKWICEVCGKQFTYRSSHHSHVKSHLPPRFKCSVCDYKTWHKADMNKHIRTHTGVKHYVCEFCTSTFNNTSNLHGHIRRVHGGAKTKNCPRCDLAFFTEDKLRRHLDTHDNIKRYECEVCHTQFTRRCHWKKHLQKQHSITVPQVRPGRRKVNDVSGAIPDENLFIIEAIQK